MKKQVILFSSANLIGTLLSMLGSIWVANIAGPSLMGVFNFLQLMVVYAPILGLGVFNGLNRELPYSVGKGKHEEAERLAAVALYVCAITSLVIIVGMSISSLVAWMAKDVLWFSGLAIFAIVLPLSLFRTYLEVTLRTAHDFNWLSVVKVVLSVAGLALVPLMYVDSWGGLLGRSLLLMLIAVGLLWMKRRYRVIPCWDVSLWKRLVSIGLPIFVVGYIYTIFTSMDRFIILSDLNLDALGTYTPALLILQAMTILPSSVAQVLYPRATEHYGREGAINKLLLILFLPLPIMFVIQLPVVLIGWIYMDVLILQYMPQFSEGSEAARWALLVGLALSMSTPAIIFNVVRKQRMYVTFMLVSILAIVVAWLLGVGGQGLVGVGVAMLIGSICFVALSASGAWYLCTRDAYVKST